MMSWDYAHKPDFLHLTHLTCPQHPYKIIGFRQTVAEKLLDFCRKLICINLIHCKWQTGKHCWQIIAAGLPLLIDFGKLAANCLLKTCGKRFFFVRVPTSTTLSLFTYAQGKLTNMQFHMYVYVTTILLPTFIPIFFTLSCI